MIKLPSFLSLAALTAGLLWSSTPPVHAQLYISAQSNGIIGTYNATTGATINANFVTGLKDPEGLLIVRNVLYEADYDGNTVGTFDATTGAAINPALITGINGPDGLAIYGNTLFVSTIFGTVGSYDLTTGAAINANLITGLGNAQNMVGSGTHLFVAESQGNRVVEIDAVTGTVLNASFITGLNGPAGVTVSGNILFVANFGTGSDGTVGKYDATTGAAIDASFIPSGLDAPNSLAVAGDTLYVCNLGGAIGAYDATTGAASSDHLIGGLNQPVSIAVASFGGATPTPNPTATPAPSATPTPSPSPSPSLAPTPSPFPSATPPLTALACAIISPPVEAPIAAGSALPVAVAVRDDNPNATVLSVAFYLDGNPVGTTGTSGFHVTITAPAAGNHVLKAVARDSVGQTAIGTEQLTTYTPGNPPPTITDIDGLDGYTVVDGQIVVGADEAEANGPGNSISGLNYYTDAMSMNGGTGSPIGYNRRGPGPVRLDAATVSPLTGGGSLYRLAIAISNAFVGNVIHIFSVATDANGEQQISAVSTLHVKDASVVGTPPVVTLGVAEGTRLPVGQATAIPVTATGANGTAPSHPVALIQYQVNGQVVSDSNASPNGFSFTPPTAGQYLFNAVATDVAGLSGFGTPVLVTAFDVPVVTLKVKGSGTAVAGGTPAKVLVSRTGDTSAALTVSYKVASADAVSGVDYRALTGKLVISAGESSARIRLTAMAGSKLDGTAKVKIKLKPVADASYTLGATSKVQIKLLGND